MGILKAFSLLVGVPANRNVLRSLIALLDVNFGGVAEASQWSCDLNDFFNFADLIKSQISEQVTAGGSAFCIVRREFISLTIRLADL
jgi:hypothetical protein